MTIFSPAIHFQSLKILSDRSIAFNPLPTAISFCDFFVKFFVYHYLYVMKSCFMPKLEKKIQKFMQISGHELLKASKEGRNKIMAID